MIAKVVVDLSNDAVDKSYDYLCDDNLKVGQRVLVPFGKKEVAGFCVGISDQTDCPLDKLKKVVGTPDDFVSILPEQLKLLDYMRKIYHLRMVDILRLFLPSSLRSGKVQDKFEKVLILNEELDLIEYKNSIRKNAKQQLSLLSYMLDNKKERYTRLAKLFLAGAVNKLTSDGVLIAESEQVLRKPQTLSKEDKNFVLSPDQKNAVEKIINSSDKNFLLFGVTGSGKTEVYMRVIQDCIEKGKTAILLVPEIALTSALMATIIARFGSLVALIHSGLGVGERYDEWKRILFGQAKIVVGVRSAIFAPISNLGVVIIDEEHDASYFSESNPRYSTHEVAQWRADFNGAKLILGSATPSIESFSKTLNGQYQLIEMCSRISEVGMDIKIVDMRNELAQGNASPISYAMQQGLSLAVENGRQALVFINRRGYSSFQRCVDCGYVAKCSDCDVSLVVHKEDMQLKCHYCGKRFKILTHCPMCKGSNLKQGAIGTEQVAEILKKQFPNVPIFRMDNDTTKSKNSHFEILRKFSQSKPAILVGTQMIAKGHDFPDVEFVGILDADQSLHFADYLANERTFQLITQVVGRSGRGAVKGKVVLQTLMPKHYVYRYAINNAYKEFFTRELNLRETTKFPPYAKIIRILFTGSDELETRDVLSAIYSSIRTISKDYENKIYFLSAMASPIKRLQNKHRYQILMRYDIVIHNEIIQKIYGVVDDGEKKNVSIFVEINPQNLS